jgi:hypothetical protein
MVILALKRTQAKARVPERTLSNVFRASAARAACAVLFLTACSAASAKQNNTVPPACAHPPRTQADVARIRRDCPDIEVVASLDARISDDGQYLEVTGCHGQACGDFHPYRVRLAEVPRDQDGRLMLYLNGDLQGRVPLRVGVR